MLVWCECCPDHPGWSWCWYLVKVGTHWEWRGPGWVYVQWCLHREPTEKEYRGEFDQRGPEASARATPATIVATLPADAKLSIDGKPTVSTSGTRVFVTPPLESGHDFSYTLQVERLREGVMESVTRQVTVRAGEETRVDLGQLERPAAAIAAN
jgi:uncharacterized protein (TIGR03000 family)